MKLSPTSKHNLRQSFAALAAMCLLANTTMAQPASLTQSSKTIASPAKQAVVELPPPKYPRAPGMELAQTKCTVCHGAEQFLSARLSPQAWKKTLDKMHGFGARITPAEKSLLLEYLSSNLRPDTPKEKPTKVRLAPPSL